MKSSKVKLTELKYYFKRDSQCLSKHVSNVIFSQVKFLQRSCESFFYELSRTKYRNLFIFVGQLRYVSTVINKKTVENFGGNHINVIKS